MPTALDAKARRRIESIVRQRGEPLPIEAIARRFFEEEAKREVVSYTPDHSYLVGEWVAWETRSFGRLIGEVTAIEFVGGRWRLLVDWDPRLSPKLEQYLENRRSSRLAYLMDPRADSAAVVETSTGGASIAALLSHDLEDDVRATEGFVEWAGLWAPASLLPAIDDQAFAAAAEHATEDDGIAESNEVIALLGLPGPNERGYGFAAIAVNLRMRERGGWIWGGPRDGGQWLPRRRVDAISGRLGRPPRFEEMRIIGIPGLEDHELPEALADLIVEATLRGIAADPPESTLRHVVSDWERTNAALVLDAHEFSWFPPQATIQVRSGEQSCSALLVEESRILSPEAAWFREALSTAVAIEFTRIGHTDEFDLSFERGAVSADGEQLGGFDLLRAVLAAFEGGEPRTAQEVVDSVRSRIAGDEAVLARAVASMLAGYACFEQARDDSWTYLANAPHGIHDRYVAIPLDRLVKRAARARQDAVHQDREMRRWRADTIRSPHLVRGHLRRLRKSVIANPVQVALAKRHGIAVPRGYTFVRPHERHGGHWASF